MNDSNIDQSCWLPRGEAIVTPERLAMGDLSFRFSNSDKTLEIQLTIKNILNYLYDHEVINEQNLYDAQTVQIWQMIWRAAHGLERCNSTLPRSSADCRFKELGYSMLLQRLSRCDFQAIDSAINTLTTSHNIFIVQNRKQTYRRAFETLSAVLPPIRERIDALEANKEEYESL